MVAQDSVQASRRRQGWRAAWRVLGTVAFVAILVFIAPVGDWVDSVRTARPLPVFIGLSVVLLLGVLEATRLLVLARLPRAEVGPATHLVFAAACVAHLPFGFVGSDVYRAAGLRRMGTPTGASLGVVAAARTLGFGATFLATCGGALWALSTGADVVDGSLRRLSAVSAVLLVLVVVLTVAAAWLGRTGIAQRRSPGWLRQVGDALGEVRGGVLLTSAGLSVAVAMVRVGVVFACAAALGAEVSVAAAVVATGTGVVASVVPSILGGVGPQEAGLAGALLLFGVDPAAAVVVALLSRAVSLGGAVVGYGLSWPFRRAPG